jgi:hypothetical protein
MAVIMGDDEREERAERRDYTDLFVRLCNCAGPQPGLSNPRADEHADDCPYRQEVEGDT